MSKRQQINLQPDYSNDNFLEPEDLQSEEGDAYQQSQARDDKASGENSNPTKSQQNKNANSTPNNGPAPTQPPTNSKPNPQKKPPTYQRSSLEQDSDSQQQIRKQLTLEFKISELQKICTTLTSANQKLLDKIQELQEQNELYKERITRIERGRQQQQEGYPESLNDSRQSAEANESAEESNYRKQDTNRSEDESQLLANDEEDEQRLLEEEVTGIEVLIKEYRQELKRSEEVHKSVKDSLTQKISQLEDELTNTQELLSETQRVNSELEQQLIEVQQKCESFQRDIENLINSGNMEGSNNYDYYEDQTGRNRTQSRSSQQYMTPVHRANYQRPVNNRPGYYEEDYSQQGSNQFDSSVQLQLQKLIQKLVHELEHQRNVKKRMTEEMKRIQKDLLENQKEIMVKNKKIYELEMNLLKGEKNHLFNIVNTPLSNSQVQPFEPKKEEKVKYSIFSREEANNNSNHNSNHNNRQYNSPNSKEISPKIREKYLQQERQRINTSAANYSPNRQQSPVSDAYTNANKVREYNPSRNPNISQSPSSAQTKHLQTFSLLQLLNEPTITLTVKQKLHISLKLVQFYEQKIYQYKNYNLLMLENVLVTNFNRIKLGFMKIRVEEHKRSEEGNQRIRKDSKDKVADGPEKVIWNLGFLLNSLLNDVPTKEEDFGGSSAEQSISSLVQGMLDNTNLKKEVLVELKECLEIALEERGQ